MRKGAAVLVLVLAVGLQRSDAQSFTPGISPRNITFTPVNTSNIVGGQQNLQQIFRPPPQPSPFNPLNLFRKITTLSWPPTTANAPVIPARQGQNGTGTAAQQGAAQRRRMPMQMPTTMPTSQ